MIQAVQQDIAILKKGGEALNLVYQSLGASPTSPNTTPSDEIAVIAEIQTAVTEGDVEALDTIIGRYAD